MAVTRNVLATANSDAGRFVKGKKVTSATGAETVGVAMVPKKAFIEAVWIEIVTAFPGAATTALLTVGFTGNGESQDDTFFGDSTVSLPKTAGLKKLAVSKYFETAGGMITVTSTRGDAASGVAYRVFVDYEVAY